MRNEEAEKILESDEAISIFVYLLEVSREATFAPILRITFVHSFENTRLFKYYISVNIRAAVLTFLELVHIQLWIIEKTLYDVQLGFHMVCYFVNG